MAAEIATVEISKEGGELMIDSTNLQINFIADSWGAMTDTLLINTVVGQDYRCGEFRVNLSDLPTLIAWLQRQLP